MKYIKESDTFKDQSVDGRKHIKEYNLFESLKDEIDMLEIEDRLIDFKQLGLDIYSSISDSMILDFNRIDPESELGKLKYMPSYYASEYEMDRKESIIINIENRINGHREEFTLNINELKEIYYDMLFPYLSSLGLSLNYFFITCANRFMYFFGSIINIIDWAKEKGFEKDIKIRRLALCFYKK